MHLLGLDWGTKNIGLALSDLEGRVAFPYDVILAQPFDTFLKTLKNVIQKEQVKGVVVGVPKGTLREPQAREFAARLQGALGVPVKTQNESRSTKAVGEIKKSKQTRRGRSKIYQTLARKRDQFSAAMILQEFLDGSRKL
jgi:putative Holliday junction resolvase